MPTVRVLFFAHARDATGCSQVELKADTLAGALDQSCAAYPALAAVLANSRVWINGDEPLTGMTTDLNENDEIAVLPPVSGGGQ